jgi:Protein O-mannosyl-transferase TMEM260-like
MEFTRKKLAWHYVAALGAAMVLYVISCAPGALWQDSGLIQYRVWHNDIQGSLGLALSHPLFYILAIGAKYIPLGAFAHRVNLVSAVAAAVAVANLFLLVRLWLGVTFPAVIAAITLAVSHTFWRHAAIAETYTLWAALFTGELIMLLQYSRTKRVGYLYMLALLNGLSIAVHVLAVIPLLCYAVLVLYLLAAREIRIRDMVMIVLLWIIGALPYEYLIVTTIRQTGDIGGTLASAAFGKRWQGAVLNTSLSVQIAGKSFLYILYNFPTPNILLFLTGCFALFRLPSQRAFRNVLLATIALFFIFAFRYTVPDRYAFFIPFYVGASILIGLGAYLLQNQMNSKAFAFLILLFSLLPAGVYAATPTLARKIHLNIGTRGDIPYRNDYEYFLQPWKTGYTGAQRFADEALRTAAHNAIIYADATTAAPLVLAQEVDGKRRDVKIVSGTLNSEDAPRFDAQTIGPLLAERPIYVVSRRPRYCPDFVLENYNMVQASILWQVTKR